MLDAKIEQRTDVLVKINTTNICDSDLHMYEERTDMEAGRIFGLENLGVVIVSYKDRLKLAKEMGAIFRILIQI